LVGVIAATFHTGESAGNVGMDAGATFSETDGDMFQKLVSAGAAVAG